MNLIGRGSIERALWVSPLYSISLILESPAVDVEDCWRMSRFAVVKDPPFPSLLTFS